MEKTGTGNQPYAIALADRGLMALAGLWENWRSPAGEWIRSFAIVTTEPNELCADVHNRMPVVLKPESWPVWLGEEPTVPSDLKALLAPFPSEEEIGPTSETISSEAEKEQVFWLLNLAEREEYVADALMFLNRGTCSICILHVRLLGAIVEGNMS